MSNYPEELKYTSTHEWIKVEGHTAIVGITDFAQDQLGDVVYVELPAVGKQLKAGEEFGVVESVKSVSSLYSPVSGKVIAVNQELSNHPEFVNQEPYGKGWIIKLEPANRDEFEKLFSAQDYQKVLESEKH
ncbi:MAG: glycine cleavage system protein GcvH [Candidatus Margulisiibacteriota bacterium]